MNGKVKVMFVDDSPTDLKLISEPLLSQEYDLVKVADDEATLKKADTDKPDLVILDVSMLKLNVLKVCRQIKNHTKIKKLVQLKLCF